MELRSRAGAVVGLAAVAVSLAACSPGTAAGQTYADGTYSAEGEYATPETVEKIEVTITLADNVITAVQVSGTPMRPETVRFQGQFVDGIAAEVVGVVTTAKKRIANHPNVPTLEEVGVKGVGNTLWHAIWAPNEGRTDN